MWLRRVGPAKLRVPVPCQWLAAHLLVVPLLAAQAHLLAAQAQNIIRALVFSTLTMTILITATTVFTTVTIATTATTATTTHSHTDCRISPTPSPPSPCTAADKDHFAALAVEAIMRLKGSGNLESIHIIKKPGGALKVRGGKCERQGEGVRVGVCKLRGAAT